ncbi:ParB family chromosome partitioning protein [Prauserella isguenensis]|uniref:ParB family chromosome partitioning protein n=1 Tax=Prauserella isguenensis TaxID=1470180 RepID=A0A839S828_9PSEU|nr:ParB/RepB/Spo0J family partition protein [Prauserella isguenensis]MBB3053524.1 ParB family chromosome partitioning protein [Prauserella isguenensis]
MGGRRGISGSAQPQTTTPSTVPVTSIAHNPRNPRTDYDDVGELAESLSEVGVLQPLGVVRYEVFLTHYPDHEHDVGAHDWVVVNGNRRLAAAQKAGLEKVPVHVVDHLGREEALDESVLVENIHREALPPLREAEAIRLLVDRHGSQRAVAKRISKTNGFVSQRLALLELEDSLKAALESGQLGLADARRVAKLPPGEQTAEWERIQQEGTSPAGPAEITSESGRAEVGGVYPVNTPASERPPKRPRTVPLKSPEQIANDLKTHLDAAELQAVVVLLTD